MTSDRFRFRAELGNGAMGRVFSAHDSRLDRLVAIKELQFVKGAASFHHAHAEARLMATVSHPAVVQVHDVVEADGKLLIVMALLSGVTLQRKLQDRKLSVGDVARIMRIVCEGVHALHSKNVIHRDLKPSNIMISDDGVPTIFDLGVATPATDQRTMVAGTTKYMAPELFIPGQSASARSDIYSLGVMFYEAFALPKTFDEILSPMSFAQWQEWHRDVESRLPPLHTVQPAVSQGLSEIIAKMSAKSVSERYSTVHAVLADLANLPDVRGNLPAHVVTKVDRRDPELTEALDPSPRVFPVRDGSRRRLMIAVTGIAGTALALAAALWSSGNRFEEFIARADAHYGKGEWPAANGWYTKAEKEIDNDDPRRQRATDGIKKSCLRARVQRAELSVPAERLQERRWDQAGAEVKAAGECLLSSDAEGGVLLSVWKHRVSFESAGTQLAALVEHANVPEMGEAEKHLKVIQSTPSEPLFSDQKTRQRQLLSLGAYRLSFWTALELWKRKRAVEAIEALGRISEFPTEKDQSDVSAQLAKWRREFADHCDSACRQALEQGKYNDAVNAVADGLRIIPEDKRLASCQALALCLSERAAALATARGTYDALMAGVSTSERLNLASKALSMFRAFITGHCLSAKCDTSELGEPTQDLIQKDCDVVGRLIGELQIAEESLKFEGLLERAARLQREGDCRTAVKVLESVVRDRPQLARARTMMALCHVEVGNLAKAEEAVRSAFRIDTFSGEAFAARARLHLARGRIADALDDLDAALADVDPEAQPARWCDIAERRAGVYMAMVDNDAAGRIPGLEPAQLARQDFERCLRLFPNRADLPALFAMALVRLGAYEEARERSEEAIARIDEEPYWAAYGYFIRALAEAQSGLSEQAVKSLQAALSSDYLRLRSGLEAPVEAIGDAEFHRRLGEIVHERALAPIRELKLMQDLRLLYQLPIVEGMTLIAGGEFRQGDDNAESDDERPGRVVKLSPYFIDTTEVSNDQYAEFLADIEGGFGGLITVDALCDPDKDHTPAFWAETFGAATPDLPVVGVDWCDAAAYCAWAEQRMVTEAEWERAARGPGDESRVYPWGNNAPSRSINIDRPRLRLQPASGAGMESDQTAEGVRCLGGNVAEWCRDAYDSVYYRKSVSLTDPVREYSPEERIASQVGDRVVRGSASNGTVGSARCTRRGHADPANRAENRGFRCALTADQDLLDRYSEEAPRIQLQPQEASVSN